MLLTKCIGFNFSFRPLEKTASNGIELCMCCTCYPWEEEEEEVTQYSADLIGHPYLSSTDDQQTSVQWRRSEDDE